MCRTGRVDPVGSSRWKERKRQTDPAGQVQTHVDQIHQPAEDAWVTLWLRLLAPFIEVQHRVLAAALPGRAHGRS
jgi:hypothetical protein